MASVEWCELTIVAQKTTPSFVADALPGLAAAVSMLTAGMLRTLVATLAFPTTAAFALAGSDTVTVGFIAVSTDRCLERTDP